MLATLAFAFPLLQQPAPSPTDLASRGIALAEANDCDAALPLLDEALPLLDDRVVALRWRGHCRNLKGLYELALADYDAALSIDGSDPWTHYARAMSLRNLGRFDAAVIGYTLAIGLAPDYLKAIQWRGYTNAQRDRHDLAVADFDAALGLAPGDYWTLTSRAWSHSRLGQFKQAAGDYDRALLAWIDDGRSWANMGFARWLAGFEGAPVTSCFTRAIDLDPKNTAHAALWRWWATEDIEQANGELRGWRAARDQEAAGDWDDTLVALVLGEPVEDRLALHLANAADQASGLATEADFYQGLLRARRGELRGARRSLRRAWLGGDRNKWEWSGAGRLIGDLAEEFSLEPTLGFETEPYPSPSDDALQSRLRVVRITDPELSQASQVEVGSLLFFLQLDGPPQVERLRPGTELTAFVQGGDAGRTTRIKVGTWLPGERP